MLLAAGEARRLRPYTDSTPKPMLNIAGRPILEHNVRLLAHYGVRRAVINLHHCPEVIVDHFGDGSRFGIEIRYSREPHLLGTAGGVKNAAQWFTETFLVLYGDNLIDCDLAAMTAMHRQNKAVATIGLFHREDVLASGIVGIDKENRVTRFLEKPGHDQVFSNWVNAGVLVLEPQVLERIPAGAASDFGREILPALVDAGQRVCGFPIGERLWWIDSIEDYDKTRAAADTGKISLSY